MDLGKPRWVCQIKKKAPESFTDIQRAARVLFLHQVSFGGKLTSPAFGYSKAQPSRLNLIALEERLVKAHERIKRAYIENLPYGDLIARYDSENSFFYIDPPYWNHEKDYGKIFLAKKTLQRCSTNYWP